LSIHALVAKIQHDKVVGWFVRSFVLFGQKPSLLWTPARRPRADPVRLPLGERRGIDWRAQCVRDVQERQIK